MVQNSHRKMRFLQCPAVGYGKQENVYLIWWASSSQAGRGVWKKVPEPQKVPQGAVGTIEDAEGRASASNTRTSDVMKKRYHSIGSA